MKQDMASIRRELEHLIEPIVRALQLKQLTAGDIKKEIQNAVERTLSGIRAA